MLRILSIDGGGVRGIIPVIWLTHLEKRSGKRAADLFDLIVGTSVGGMIALALTCPRDGGAPYSAAELRHLDLGSVKKIFPRGHHAKHQAQAQAQAPGTAAYSAAPLQEFLHQVMGNAKLSEAYRPVGVVTCDLAHTQALHFTGGGLDQSQLGDADMALAARATSSLPKYFPAVDYTDPGGTARELVDGGLAADDPALVAYSLGRTLQAADDGALLVSLGTGTSERSSGLLLSSEQTRNKAEARGPERDFSMVLEGPGQLMRESLRRLLGGDYVRIQTRLLPGTHHDSDDASPKNILGLLATAEKMVLESSAELDRLSAVLQEPPVG